MLFLLRSYNAKGWQESYLQGGRVHRYKEAQPWVKGMFTQSMGRFNETAVVLVPITGPKQPTLDHSHEQFGINHTQDLVGLRRTPIIHRYLRKFRQIKALNQTQLAGTGDGFCTPLDLELTEDIPIVPLDRTDGEEKSFSNLLI